MKIACDFRERFKRDVVIDLVCYRPAITRPMNLPPPSH